MNRGFVTHLAECIMHDGFILTYESPKHLIYMKAGVGDSRPEYQNYMT
jgi:hypothetical protein